MNESSTLLTVTAILTFALLVQFVVDILKGMLPAFITKYISSNLLAAAVGVLTSFSFSLDVFKMLGYSTPNASVAYFITGLIISAGASPVHELIAKIRESRGDLSG